MVLQRTFSSFPAGWPGAALLLLRIVVGGSAIIEATLSVAPTHPLLNLIARAVIGLSGLSLIIGLLTPIASGTVALVGGILLVCISPAFFNLVDSHMALFELVVMASALLILGPGATSFDAILFGRREVMIRSAQKRDNASE